MWHQSNLSSTMKNDEEHGLHFFSQYAGNDIREAEVKKQKQLLHMRNWKSEQLLIGTLHLTTLHCLCHFVCMHRTCTKPTTE